MSQDQSIPRMVSHTDDALKFAELGVYLHALPCPLKRVQAFAVCCGTGEVWRLLHARDEFQEYITCKFLLIAGTNSKEDTHVHFDVLCNHLEARYPERVSVMYSGNSNTLLQAEYVMGEVQGKQIKSLAVFASWYHTPRVFATMLAVMLKVLGKDQRIPLFVVPTPMTPSAIVPESMVLARDSFAGECSRYCQYSTKGDIATLEECWEQLEWQSKHEINQGLFYI